MTMLLAQKSTEISHQSESKWSRTIDQGQCSQVLGIRIKLCESLSWKLERSRINQDCTVMKQWAVLWRRRRKTESWRMIENLTNCLQFKPMSLKSEFRMWIAWLIFIEVRYGVKYDTKTTSVSSTFCSNRRSKIGSMRESGHVFESCLINLPLDLFSFNISKTFAWQMVTNDGKGCISLCRLEVFIISQSFRTT